MATHEQAQTGVTDRSYAGALLGTIKEAQVSSFLPNAPDLDTLFEPLKTQLIPIVVLYPELRTWGDIITKLEEISREPVPGKPTPDGWLMFAGENHSKLGERIYNKSVRLLERLFFS